MFRQSPRLSGTVIRSYHRACLCLPASIPERGDFHSSPRGFSVEFRLSSPQNCAPHFRIRPYRFQSPFFPMLTSGTGSVIVNSVVVATVRRLGKSSRSVVIPHKYSDILYAVRGGASTREFGPGRFFAVSCMEGGVQWCVSLRDFPQ